MQMNVCALAILGAVLTSYPSLHAYASSPYKDGNLLLKECNNGIRFQEEQDMALLHDASVCMETVTTIVRQEMASSLIKEVPQVFCPPSDSQIGQHVRVIVNYLKASPKNLHLDGVVLANYALSEAYPCSPR